MGTSAPEPPIAVDDAAMQSLFATLTKECTDRVRFESRTTVVGPFKEYFECFL